MKGVSFVPNQRIRTHFDKKKLVFKSKSSKLKKIDSGGLDSSNSRSFLLIIDLQIPKRFEEIFFYLFVKRKQENLDLLTLNNHLNPEFFDSLQKETPFLTSLWTLVILQVAK